MLPSAVRQALDRRRPAEAHAAGDGLLLCDCAVVPSIKTLQQCAAPDANHPAPSAPCCTIASRPGRPAMPAPSDPHDASPWRARSGFRQTDAASQLAPVSRGLDSPPSHPAAFLLRRRELLFTGLTLPHCQSEAGRPIPRGPFARPSTLRVAQLHDEPAAAHAAVSCLQHHHCLVLLALNRLRKRNCPAYLDDNRPEE